MTTVHQLSGHGPLSRLNIYSGASPYTQRVRPSYELIEAPTRQATNGTGSVSGSPNSSSNSTPANQGSLPSHTNPQLYSSITRKERPELFRSYSGNPRLSKPYASSKLAASSRTASYQAMSYSVSPTSTNSSVATSLNYQSSRETGISKDHWKPDSDVSVCSFPSCSVRFGLFDRRHHCRRCGDIFCALHCDRNIPLTMDVKFCLAGSLYRSCVSCFYEYLKWKQSIDLASSNDITVIESTIAPQQAATHPPSQPKNAVSVPIPKMDSTDSKGELPSESLVLGTVPDNWVWSTF
ncbi:FYVE-type zinc finger-containing protein C9B6.03 [Schizosaccharomyces pombe]